MIVKKFFPEEKDCNKDKKLPLSVVQRYMQICAGEDYDSYGTTGDEMHENGMSFVITKIAMDVYNDIYAGDKVEVFSLHDRSEGVSLIREFLVISQRGLCCRATTVWIVFDLKTRRILRPNTIANYPPAPNVFNTQVESERRIFAKDEVPEPVCEITVTKDHIDNNGHVNNTYYQDFLAKVIECRHCDKKIAHVQISYIHEAFEGAALKLSGIFTEDTARIRADNGDNCCFEALVRFTEKKDGE